MSFNLSRVFGLIPVFLLCCVPAAAQEMQTPLLSEAEGIEFFENKIRPVLVRECYGCHSNQSGQGRGGLKLDTKMAMLLGGDSGASLVPGSLEDSPLWSAINYEDYSMPPNKKLSADIIEDFRQWIEMGAPDPRGQETAVSVNSSVTAEDVKEGREFWSFQRPRKPSFDNVPENEWSRGPIDHLVLSELQSNNMQPATDADPGTLLRRLCFDLIGLPPTPYQIEWFMAKWETDPDQAVAGTVDRLLDSDRFGERWGRHWLDVARYAESSGKEINATFPHAWRYRDYVIDSFNEDKRYDRFVEEQIAGDLLPVRSDEQWAENLIATGFLAVGPKTLTEQNPRQFRADLIDEQIDVSTRVFLGVSVACARCHDHKFDPIPQSDYYAMAGIFGSMETYYGTLDTRQNRRPSDLLLLPVEDLSEFDKPLSADELAKLKAELTEVEREYRELARKRREARRSTNPSPELLRSIRQFAQTGARMAALQSVIDSYNEDGTAKTFCMGVQSTDPIEANLLVRGEVDQPAQKISRGFVQVVGNNRKIRDQSTGRLELARWMSDEDNPLTARVMANRIWQHLIGKGIVESTENFGATGQPPTHPELLDYLAVSFMDKEWSIKQLIREIATSRTYRMSAAYNAEYYERDPDNKLLWRASPRRLEAEALRDAMLSVGGKLETERPRASEVARGGKTIVRRGTMRNTRESILQQTMN
ncbi:MAG: PSD1 and planctomycete cytochrome C domain-containing protein, partial [Pirellulaceae bacterium]